MLKEGEQKKEKLETVGPELHVSQYRNYPKSLVVPMGRGILE